VHLGEDLGGGNAEGERRAVDDVEQVGDRIGDGDEVALFERGAELRRLLLDERATDRLHRIGDVERRVVVDLEAPRRV
jgi:hypothetical protein